MIGMIGRTKGKEKKVVYNRLAHPDEAVHQCLTVREFWLLRSVLDGDKKLDDKVWLSFQQHIEGCCKCREIAAQEFGFHPKAVRVIGLGDDSLHTSTPPERSCSVFCRTHQVTKNPNQSLVKDETPIH